MKSWYIVHLELDSSIRSYQSLNKSHLDFTMAIKKTSIQCCKGEYHVLVDGKYYCMAPPNIECTQMMQGRGQIHQGGKENSLLFAPGALL